MTPLWWATKDGDRECLAFFEHARPLRPRLRLLGEPFIGAVGPAESMPLLLSRRIVYFMQPARPSRRLRGHEKAPGVKS